MFEYRCVPCVDGIFSVEISIHDFDYLATKRCNFKDLLTIDQLLDVCNSLVPQLKERIQKEIGSQYTYCDNLQKEIKNRCERAEKLENILANRF